ncbi:MAG: TrbC/VirB2 family protein [Rickettsiales bacterium]|nr:TrbC/VirB2 family protein [Rickettsiales bacterium]
MNLIFKNIFLFNLAILFLLIPELSFSDPAQSELAGKICDIRQLFCGGVALAVASFAILAIGFLTLRGGVHWSLLLIVTIGIILFISADAFVSDLSGGTVDVNCQCM